MRSLALVFVLALAVGIIGCGSSEPPAEPMAEQPAELQPVAENPAPESLPAEPAAELEPQPAAEPGPAPKPEREPAAAPKPLPTLYDFTAVWCPPCKQQGPIVAALEQEYEGKVHIQAIDVDQNQELAAKYDVKAIPTLVFLDREGNEAARFVGLSDREKIVNKFKELGFTD